MATRPRRFREALRYCLAAYRVSRDAFYRSKGRANIDFPEGTYLIRKRFAVNCVPVLV